MTARIKLYVTPTSPYAWLVRIVVREKGLEGRVEEIGARTREAGSPYYAVNPSGRVPCLVLGDGTVMEDSALICDYLDELDGAPAFARPVGADRWTFAMAEARARGLLDGLAVLVRELRRPENERSPTIIDHELARARRLLAVWEGEAEGPLLTGPLNHVQMLMICALDTARRVPGAGLLAECPGLSAWLERASSRPSVAATGRPPD